MYKELINYATESYPFLIEHTDVKYIPHFHTETELVYVLGGELTVTLGMNNCIIKKGDICIIPSGHIHNLYTESHSRTFVFKLYPVVDLSSIRLKDYIITKEHKLYNELKGYLTNIICEEKFKPKGYAISVNINAEKIFLMIIRHMEYIYTDEKQKSKKQKESDFLNAVNDFLGHNYINGIGLEDVARRFNYTKSYFCRYFKKITGTTFWDYYTIFRLDKSIEFMKTSDKENITQIAVNSGFGNARSFNQAFKSFYRCTPKEYKKMIIQIK